MLGDIYSRSLAKELETNLNSNQHLSAKIVKKRIFSVSIYCRLLADQSGREGKGGRKMVYIGFTHIGYKVLTDFFSLTIYPAVCNLGSIIFLM